MGKIDRLKRITRARIEAFLTSLEKPEYILPQLIRELGEQAAEAANAQAKALSAVKAARRRLDEANGRVLRLEQGARLAVRADDLETARQAIAAQIDAEQQVRARRDELDLAEKAYNAACGVCADLTANLAALKEKKSALLKQHRQQQVTRQLQDRYVRSVVEPGKDILDIVARMESGLEQQQIECEVRSELTRTLGVDFHEERVKKLERDSQVDQRLEAIRQQLDKP